MNNNIMGKLLDDKAMENLMKMAKSMAEVAADNKCIIGSSLISFMIGGATIYLYARLSQSKAMKAEMTQVPDNTINRANPPAPIVPTSINSVTGPPEITPPDKIIHRAPDVYGSAAPGPHGMEIHEGVARQQARNAKEAKRAARQARDVSVNKSMDRVHELGAGMAGSETELGGVATAIRGIGGVGAGEGDGRGESVGRSYGYDTGNSNDASQASGSQILQESEQDGDESEADAANEGSWNDSVSGPGSPQWGPRSPRPY